MTIEDMHYDVLQKLSKIDSNKYKRLVVPEIDWMLNESQDIIIKNISQPRRVNALGFEINQRTIDRDWETS